MKPNNFIDYIRPYIILVNVMLMEQIRMINKNKVAR